jgi:hypothetical protein
MHAPTYHRRRLPSIEDSRRLCRGQVSRRITEEERMTRVSSGRRVRGKPPSVVRKCIEEWSTPEPSTGCWLWMRGAGSGGYGTISVGGKTVRTNRASYEAFYGPIPEGLFVLHSCDQKLCVNPEHLSADTRGENTRQAYARGLTPRLRGTKNHNAKFSEADVTMWHVMHMAGMSGADVARAYNTSRSVVNLALRGKSWRHVFNTLRTLPDYEGEK